MAAGRRHIDITTGDYELVGGRLRESKGIAANVILVMRMRRGTCPVAPELGTRLHEIRKLTTSAPRLAREYVREGLSHLVKRGDLRDLEVEATAEGSLLSITLSYVDRTGEEQTLPFTRPVG